MTISVIRQLFSHYPELQYLVKQASDLPRIVDGFPTDDRALTLLSAAKLMYMQKIAEMPVPVEVIVHVKKAGQLYDVLDAAELAIQHLSSTMLEKTAAASRREYEVSQTLRRLEELEASGNVTELVKIASTVNENVDKYPDIVGTPTLAIYSGDMPLDRDSTILALEKRAYVTKDQTYKDLANVLVDKQFSGFSKEANEKILNAVQSTDEIHYLSHRGWNIYKEARVKTASQTLSIAGKAIPLQRVLDVLPDLTDALGKDTVDEILKAGPDAAPAIEALPSDLKAIIGRYV